MGIFEGLPGLEGETLKTFFVLMKVFSTVFTFSFLTIGHLRLFFCPHEVPWISPESKGGMIVTLFIFNNIYLLIVFVNNCDLGVIDLN